MKIGTKKILFMIDIMAFLNTAARGQFQNQINSQRLFKEKK